MVPHSAKAEWVFFKINKTFVIDPTPQMPGWGTLRQIARWGELNPTYSIIIKNHKGRMRYAPRLLTKPRLESRIWALTVGGY